jgi:hypothetical protein
MIHTKVSNVVLVHERHGLKVHFLVQEELVQVFHFQPIEDEIHPVRIVCLSKKVLLRWNNMGFVVESSKSVHFV